MSCEDKNTYLINEDQCVNDQELFLGNFYSWILWYRTIIIIITYQHSGCSDAIVPTSSLHPTTVTNFKSPSAINYLITRVGNSVTYETFKINETDQLVNSSLCRISSLEVYRGRQQAIEISDQGFSLSENGSITVHKTQMVCILYVII
jgi:hypothetical protein